MRPTGFEPRRPELDGLLGELPAERFTAAFERTVELAERYGGEWALELAHRLDLVPALLEPTGHAAGEDAAVGADAATLASRLGFVPTFQPALDWLLRRLAADGEIEALGDGRCRARGELPSAQRAELRARALAADPAVAPTLDLLDCVGGLYPALARGEVRGEQALFGSGQIALWCDYFDNRNPVYAVNNLVTATAALHRLPAGRRFSVLELGAGAGSGTAELLEQLAAAGRLDDLEQYDVTEPSAFFRRRGERTLRARFPGAPLRFSSLDINAPVPGTALERGPFDLVMAVNVLHVARDLPATLAGLLPLVAPGGSLVAGECMRLFPGQPVAAEMVFLALEGFVSVELDPVRRPNPGFLLPEQWLRLFSEAGLTAVELVPDLLSIRDVYPGFNTGAICGRRGT